MSLPSISSVWPSAFQWVESPLYTLNEELQKETYDCSVGSFVVKWYVYWPLVMCATPVTCVADVAAGIAEAFFYSTSQNHALSILQKKLIASPIQHLVFFSVNMLYPAGYVFVGLFSSAPYRLKAIFVIGVMVSAPLVGVPYYSLAQIAVSKLPNWTRPEGFSILINGGCSKYNFFYRTKRPQNTPNNKTLVAIKWEYFVKGLQLSRIDKPQLDEFEKFNNDLVKGLPMQECLGLTSNPSLNEIKKAYKKMSLFLHPDRNPNRPQLAHKLFQALEEAGKLLGLKK